VGGGRKPLQHVCRITYTGEIKTRQHQSGACGVHMCVHETRRDEKTMEVYAPVRTWRVRVRPDPDDAIVFDAYGRGQGGRGGISANQKLPAVEENALLNHAQGTR
jgi:hypothetical protein